MKLLIHFLLPFILVFNLCGQELTTQKNANKSDLKLFQKGVLLYQSNQFEKAKSLFEKLVIQNPKFIDAHLQLASVCYDLQNFACAQLHFKQVLDLDSMFNPKVYYTQALCQYQLDLFHEAEQHLIQFIRLDTIHKELLTKAKLMLPKLHFADSAVKFPVKLVPSPILPLNTEFSEYLPSVTADAKMMVFTRRTKFNDEDLYFSKFINGNWTTAMPIDELNSSFNEGSPAISPDGLSLVFTSCDRMNSFGGCDLYISYYLEDHWTEPVNMGEKINTPAYESQACFSANGNSIFFTSNRKGTYGGNDIWYSRRKDDRSWSIPKNIGSSINSSGNEDCPFVHPNGDIIYFSSDFYPGMGGKDLYYSKLSEQAQWQYPVNLGFPINSKGDESSFIVFPDGKHACFASDQNHFNNTNKQLRFNLDLFELELPEHLQVKPSSYVELFISDFKTNLPIETSIKVFDLSNNKIYFKKEREKTGHVFISLPTGADYALHVSNPDYIFEPDQFRCSEARVSYSPMVIYKKLKKTEQAPAKPIVLKNIFFESGSDKLKNESFFELDELILFLKNKKNLKLKITAHTDDVGTEADNLILATNRARSVINYLIKNGIESDRLFVEGKGESNPIESNETEAGRYQNRRIEFEIIQP